MIEITSISKDECQFCFDKFSGRVYREDYGPYAWAWELRMNHVSIIASGRTKSSLVATSAALSSLWAQLQCAVRNLELQINEVNDQIRADAHAKSPCTESPDWVEWGSRHLRQT